MAILQEEENEEEDEAILRIKDLSLERGEGKDGIQISRIRTTSLIETN